ncbi:MAG: LacI family DNA-binding transcriptional regulator [Selenomonadaceae bacterium]|nr:LacI family DNA-binding transcriptional regulator [Selenomonadaceae bacterium]
MVTIKQIADICGVSRGTVDRVLNNRGNVKPEKKEMILSVARELDYTPNPAGKALAARKTKLLLGIVMPSVGIEFFDIVIDAMKKAEKSYSYYGMKVEWHLTKGYDVDVQYKALENMIDRANAVIVSPINDDRIRDIIKCLTDNGIMVITINTDIEGSTRHCFVGTDYVNGGMTAGALMQMIGHGKLNIGITLGSLKILGHKLRLKGFEKIVDSSKNAKIIAVTEDEDDDICSYDRNTRMLQEHPEINAIFAASSGGIYGACRAVMAQKRTKDMTMVVFDTIPSTIEMIESDIIQATIYQHPRRQGQTAMQIAFDYLVYGIQPAKEKYLLSNEIRIKENVRAYY